MSPMTNLARSLLFLVGDLTPLTGQQLLFKWGC